MAARLDEVLLAAGELVLAARGSESAPPEGTQLLQVAIAIVRREESVLLVRRHDATGGISWQFPAGIVKPEAAADQVAVAETLAETDVLCSVARRIGDRVHPVTGVVCHYFLCDYLSGEANNRDPSENIAVLWHESVRVVDLIPEDRIYPPLLDVLR